MFECTVKLIPGRAKIRGRKAWLEERTVESCKASVYIDRWLWERLNLSYRASSVEARDGQRENRSFESCLVRYFIFVLNVPRLFACLWNFILEASNRLVNLGE